MATPTANTPETLAENQSLNQTSGEMSPTAFETSNNPPATATRYPSSTPSAAPASNLTPAESNYQTEFGTPVDPTTIQNTIADQYAQEINSIQANYNSLLNQQNQSTDIAKANAGVEASVAGLGGSPFETSEVGAAENEGQQKNLATVGQESGDIAKAKSDEAAALAGQENTQNSTAQSTQQQGITESQTNAANALAQMQVLGQNVPLDQLPQSAYDALFTASGITDPELFNALYQSYGFGLQNMTATQALSALKALSLQINAGATTLAQQDPNRLAALEKIAGVGSSYFNTAGVESGTANENGLDPQSIQSYVDALSAGTISSLSSVPAAYRTAVINAADQQNIQVPIADRRFVMAANGIIANYIALPGYTLVANGLPYLGRIAAAEANPGSVSDQDLLDSLTKLNTSGNAISDAQVSLITNGQSYSDWQNVISNKLGSGGVLSDSQRQQISKIANAIYQNYAKEYQPIYDQATSQLQAANIPQQFWTIPDLNNLASESGLTPPGTSAGGSSGQTITDASGKSYNLQGYATDPAHTQKVQTAINAIGKLNSPQDITSYIQKTAPNSPITSDMVQQASQKYGVSWESLLGLLSEESSLGTQGTGAGTGKVGGYNPGNVGNTGTNTNTYGSWQDGVNAAAEWLSQHESQGGSQSGSQPTQTKSGKPFDYQSAINAGYSDAEIQAYINGN